MSFRLRVTLLATAAVAIAVLVASGVVYVVVRHQLLAGVDTSLVTRAQDFLAHRGPPPDLDPSPTFVQVIRAGVTTGLVNLPGLKPAEALSRSGGEPFFSEGHVENVRGQDVHVRVYSLPVGDGLALQVARPLDEVDHTLHRLGLYLLFIGLGGIGLASGLGLLVGQAALRPVGRLTQVAEEVTLTRNLSRRIGAGAGAGSGSRDELGRLASAFDEMLGALDSSLKAQRQLVADASHELRTPLSSLRTNVEVLAGGKELSPDERGRLLADVIGQVEELSKLVGDLVELDPDAPPELEDVRLDELVRDVVARARVRTPKVEYRTELEESVVEVSRPQVERAVSNLLDNAAKWSDSVEVRVAGGEVTVRDHGPGIAEEDLPHVFDRFYRAAAARHLPGSGLGLAIVRQVAISHGGEVTAENAPDGGAVFRLRFRSS